MRRSQSTKLTVIWGARQIQKLIADGQANNSDGMDLTEQVFPVVMTGWKSSQVS
jgi:hypothetical protein